MVIGTKSREVVGLLRDHLLGSGAGGSTRVAVLACARETAGATIAPLLDGLHDDGGRAPRHAARKRQW